MNLSLEAIAHLLDPAAVAASVAAIAARLDATAEGLTAEQRAELDAAGFAYAVSRWEHREDHIAQIEAALD
ncbi:MAG: hypothetical protein OXC56_06090 [Chloroflexi bacterium]|nr:hypothetical protein [Chloroflexota bacterium]